ncbi:premnaspirodiene oxygenase-like [Canna indica]|uniref:Premnaspirodiene oxygenase-like n=1 Tax=Canna indica TaxID=4628 RepID=A0AAQ3KGV2_9LILI|nr:premnaspirodiene oxygenase-like [Canna indica]
MHAETLHTKAQSTTCVRGFFTLGDRNWEGFPLRSRESPFFRAEPAINNQNQIQGKAPSIDADAACRELPAQDSLRQKPSIDAPGQNMMDIYIFSFLFSFLLLLFLAPFFLKLNEHGSDARLPPGPRKLPVIGSLHHLLGNPLPHHALAALAKQYGPVMHLKLGEISTLVVSSPAAASEIMKTQDISFAHRAMPLATKIVGYGEKGIVMSSYGPYWREVRKVCILELLSGKRVHSFRPIREQEALNLVRSIASLSDAGSIVNLSKKLLQLGNDIVARAINGSKCTYQKEFLQLMTIGLQAAGGFSLVDLFPSSSLVRLLSGLALDMHKLHEEFDMILGSIIHEHKQRRASNNKQEEMDMVDVMLQIQDDGSLPFPLTDDSIKAIMLDLFIAGSETSATTLEWAMSELMRNPAVMKRAQREVREAVGAKEKVTEEDVNNMSYLKLVVKENFRLHPPAPLLLPRECRENTEIFGYQLPAMTRVFVNVWAMGRDPQLWEDPQEFKPERFKESTVDFKGRNFEFLPFGAGRRMCPGMASGLANVQLPLACMLYYFDWELPGTSKDELNMDETFMLTTRRRFDLCLRALPRFPCPSS